MHEHWQGYVLVGAFAVAWLLAMYGISKAIKSKEAGS